MKIISNSIIPPKGYKAVTVLNMVFVRRGCSMREEDMRHEAIHWAQEKELLIVGFYLLYVLMFAVEFLFCFFTGRRVQGAHGAFDLWHSAYRLIPFEQEAYSNESDEGYLAVRRHYVWGNY